MLMLRKACTKNTLPRKKVAAKYLLGLGRALSDDELKLLLRYWPTLDKMFNDLTRDIENNELWQKLLAGVNKIDEDALLREWTKRTAATDMNPVLASLLHMAHFSGDDVSTSGEEEK
jgi:hypothetical protein